MAFDPISPLREWKHKVASLQERWRGARLEIEQVLGEGWCFSCRRFVPLCERFAACPVCGDPQVRITAGGELRLSELEVE